MATITHISKLFKAISAGDSDSIKDAALDIISEEEKKGNSKAVKTLRGSLNPNGFSSNISAVPDQIHTAQMPILANALTEAKISVDLDEVVLKPQARKTIDSITQEWKNRYELQKNGLKNRNKLFFYGPPGCGKSMAASAIGHSLSIPTYIVRFDAIIGAYLGQTAIHLRQLFNYAEQHPCVLLFDEIDALGKQRGNPLDVGELDRIVISLMQELEHSKCQGLIIATSNLPKNIDKALWRRFDSVLEFPKPTKTQIVSYCRKLSKSYQLSFTQKLQNNIMHLSSFSEAKCFIESEARKHLLSRLNNGKKSKR